MSEPVFPPSPTLHLSQLPEAEFDLPRPLNTWRVFSTFPPSPRVFLPSFRPRDRVILDEEHGADPELEDGVNPGGESGAVPQPVVARQLVANRTIDFSKYRLPSAVDDAKKGWESSLNSVALVNVLLAGMEASLIGNLPSHKPGESSSIIALKFFAYASVLVNLSGTIACVLMIDSLADLSINARDLCMAKPDSLPRLVFTEKVKIPEKLLLSGNEGMLLYAFGLEIPWDFFSIFWGWAFPLGVCCTVVHMLLDAYVRESRLLGGILTFFGVLVFVPIVVGSIQTRHVLKTRHGKTPA